MITLEGEQEKTRLAAYRFHPVDKDGKPLPLSVTAWPNMSIASSQKILTLTLKYNLVRSPESIIYTVAFDRSAKKWIRTQPLEPK